MNRAALAFLILVLSHEANAQLFKCKDAGGKVTYTGAKCSDLGLQDAGEVKDRIQVTPAYQPPVRLSPPPARRGDDDRRPKPAAAAEPEKKPERRCFTTSVKGKTVTRCNDRPDEE